MASASTGGGARYRLTLLPGHLRALGFISSRGGFRFGPQLLLRLALRLGPLMERGERRPHPKMCRDIVETPAQRLRVVVEVTYVATLP